MFLNSLHQYAPLQYFGSSLLIKVYWLSGIDVITHFKRNDFSREVIILFKDIRDLVLYYDLVLAPLKRWLPCELIFFFLSWSHKYWHVCVTVFDGKSYFSWAVRKINILVRILLHLDYFFMLLNMLKSC